MSSLGERQIIITRSSAKFRAPNMSPNRQHRRAAMMLGLLFVLLASRAGSMAGDNRPAQAHSQRAPSARNVTAQPAPRSQNNQPNSAAAAVSVVPPREANSAGSSSASNKQSAANNSSSPNHHHHRAHRSRTDEQQRASSQPPPPPSPAAANLLAVRQHWRQMERSLGSSAESLAEQLRQQLQMLLAEPAPAANSSSAAAASAAVSAGCRSALAEVAAKLGEGSLWASQMLDSSARLPSGLLEGTLTELGNYDACLAIRSHLVQGQYCSLSIRPHLQPRPRLHTACLRLPALNNNGSSSQSTLLRWLSQNSHHFYYAGLRLGVCVPHRCSRADLQLLLTSFLAKYELLGQVRSCHLSATLPLAGLSRVDQLSATFDFGQKCILLVLFTLVGLSLAATLADCLQEQSIVRVGQQETASSHRSGHQVKRPAAPKRWKQYQVSGRIQEAPTTTSLGSNRCSECSHRQRSLALAHNLALWTGAGQQPAKEDPLLSCPKATSRPSVLNYDERCVGAADGSNSGSGSSSSSSKNTPVDDEDEEREESWIVKLEQNQQQQQRSLAPSDQVARGQKDQPAQSERRTSHILRLLSCFSLRENLKTIGKQVPSNCRQVDGSGAGDPMDDIKVIHGLRTLTMVWIIFGHSIGLVNPEMMNNLFALAHLSCSSRLLQALLNATLAVNTFFMISGVVTVISLVRRCQSASELMAPPTSASHRERPTTLEPRGLVAARPTTTTTRCRANYCGAEDDSISVASSSQSSGVSSGRRCIHGANPTIASNGRLPERKPMAAGERPCSSLLGLPGDFRPILWLLMRYLRLTPAYAAVIGLSIVMPALGDGPFWPETAGQLGAACRQNWHLNLAYLNNLLETDKLCLIHSWYLSNDWQFFLLTLLLLGLAYKSSRLALLLAVSLALASMAATFALTVVNEFPPTIVSTSPAVAERWQFIHQLYYKPWPHLNSYLIGLLVGYLLLAAKQRSLAPQQQQPSEPGWAAWRLYLVGLMVASLAALLLASVHPWNLGQRVDPIWSGLHAATFRSLWATCCGWLLYTLVRRPHLWLAKFLAWPGFQLTSRLTYCTYLIHPLVIYYHFGTLRERLDSSIYGQFVRFLATLLLSYLMALLLSLLVEAPSIRLQRLLAGRSQPSGHSCSRPPKTSAGHEEQTEPGARRGRYLESLSSSVGSSSSSASGAHCNSAAISASADSWLVGPAPRHCRPLSTSEQLARSPAAPGPNSLTILPGAGGAAGAQQPTMDAEFQRKLAQAIGRGFKIRSRMAAGGDNNAARPPPLLVEPTSLGLIQNPLHRFATSHQKLARRPPESLATFAGPPNLAGSQPEQLERRPRCSPDETAAAAKLAAFDQQLAENSNNSSSSSNNNNNSQTSLSDLIQMRRKFLSQRSHLSNVHM